MVAVGIIETQEWLAWGVRVVNSWRRRAWIPLIVAAVVLCGLFLTPGKRWMLQHGAGPSTDSEADLRAAGALAAAGRLREAQDIYLRILLGGFVRNPRAMDGLALVRQQMAHDNPETLRQQASAYLDAARQGAQTEEHYSPQSMRLLAAASLLAAVRAEAQRLKDRRQTQVRSNAQPQVPTSDPLREKQDAYLATLLGSAGNNDDAMQRLVALRRQMAHDNPYLLRQQARAYLDAASHGVETAEHYKPESMRLLAVATLMAAVQAEADHLKARYAEGSPGSPGRFRVFQAPATVSHRTAPEEGQEAPGGVNHPMSKTKLPVQSAQPDNRGKTSAPTPKEGASHPRSHPPMPHPIAPARAPGASPKDLQKSSHRALDQPVPKEKPRVRPAAAPFDASATSKRSGEIAAVDCQQRSFVLRDGGHRHAYVTTDATVTFVSETRVTGTCPLQGFIGSTAIVWSTEGRSGSIAGRIEVLVVRPASRVPRDSYPDRENDPSLRPPD